MAKTLSISDRPGIARVDRAAPIELSVIIPIFDEQDSIAPLCRSLLAVLDELACSFELIAVNDGSRDASLEKLKSEARQRPEIKIVDLRRNYGQTAALMAGIDHASGGILVAIDADLQNDPEDIPLLLEKLNEGYDVVSGWRVNRKDSPLTRNLLSRVANKLISKISGVTLRDYGCTLKAYRRDVIKDVRLYGEMHRFVPIYAAWLGAKVTEIPVKHHPRTFGKSKYGLERILKVLLDLTVVKFLDSHFEKPIYIFGGFGLLSILLAGVSGIYMLYLKFFEGIYMIQTPLPTLSAMFFLIGVVSILLGLVAEMVVRTYYESQQRTTYMVRETINLDDSD
jgi:glycosyltransferase involved in cell wall biosynthesis